MLKAVIFDLDGVIVDSEPLHFEAHKKALQGFGIVLTLEDYMEFGVAMGDRNLYEKEAEKFNINIKKEEIAPIKKAVYKKIFEKKAVPRPGIIDLLGKLHAKYALAIASSGSYDSVDFVLAALNLKKYFKVVVTGDDVEKVKPNPDIYNKAMEMLGVSKEECIAIEDSETGMLAAKNAGIRCVAVPCDFTKNQDFLQADWIFGSLEEITFEKIV